MDKELNFISMTKYSKVPDPEKIFMRKTKLQLFMPLEQL